MKQFIRLGNPLAEVNKILENRKRAKDKPIIFVVNDDVDYGLYVKKLVNVANRLGLDAYSKADLKHIEKGDLIIFGDDYIYEEDFDYRVSDDVEENVAEGEYDNKSTVVLKLTKDLDKIIELLKDNYRKERKVKDETGHRMFVRLGVSERKFDPFKEKDVRQFILMSAQPEEEDVRIHDNIVKIGYNIYKILEDEFGNEYVDVKGELRRILVDRYGKKYLE